jgi:hypothetical protein
VCVCVMCVCVCVLCVCDARACRMRHAPKRHYGTSSSSDDGREVNNANSKRCKLTPLLCREDVLPESNAFPRDGVSVFDNASDDMFEEEEEEDSAPDITPCGHRQHRTRSASTGHHAARAQDLDWIRIATAIDLDA